VGYFGFSKKSEVDTLKTETVVSSPMPILPVAETKPATVYKENLDQQNRLKTLEFKLSEARTKYEKLIRLRTVIEGHIKLRNDLLKLAQDRITHIQNLQKEGALNDQDVELARGQFTSIESSIEKSLKDKEKVAKIISAQELEVSKAETELKNFKAL
jgi:multidrug resistance efflux pump